LGKDPFADMALATWAKAGVTPAITQDPKSYTGAAYIFIEDATGNNAIIIAPGAAADIATGDVDANAALIASANVFITQLEQPIPVAVHALKLARAAGVTTILNPAPAASLPDGMLALCDYVTPNETEAEALTGLPVTSIAEAEVAARALRALGASRMGIIFSAVFPACLPSFTATSLFALEKSVRGSAALGLVGAGGIGVDLKVAFDLFNYDEALTIILMMLVLVVAVEQGSSWIRSKLI
jgi:sugar/nucleoside kinase (ribokinase family)